MCDAGRLNYKWIGRADRLKDVLVRGQKIHLDGGAQRNFRQAEESSGRFGGHHRLGAADERGTLADFKTEGQARRDERFRSRAMAKATSCLSARTKTRTRTARGSPAFASREHGHQTCRRLPNGIPSGKIKTLIVFGEDVTKHGIGADLLGKLDTLIVSDILPNETTKLAHYVLPGCAHAEKRGTFTNAKGRVQKFMKAVEAPGDARAEWEFLHDLVHNVTGQNGFVTIEGLFNQMAKEVPAFNGLTWAGLGDTGVTVQI